MSYITGHYSPVAGEKSVFVSRALLSELRSMYILWECSGVFVSNYAKLQRI